MDQTDGTLGVLADGPEFELRGAADGSAYVLRFKTDALTANIAGDDAERFREDYDTIKAQYPEWTSDQMLAQLWDQGGYSWLASQDG